jgi:hypothetical protein
MWHRRPMRLVVDTRRSRSLRAWTELWTTLEAQGWRDPRPIPSWGKVDWVVFTRSFPPQMGS